MKGGHMEDSIQNTKRIIRVACNAIRPLQLMP